jgi:hypothetical protein
MNKKPWRRRTGIRTAYWLAREMEERVAENMVVGE